MADKRGVRIAIVLVAVSVTAFWCAAATAAIESTGATSRATIRPALPEVGSAAPGFELRSIDDESYALEELRGESPLLLVFFRGAW